MTGRFVHQNVCLSAALALLLAVMSSPIRPKIVSQSPLTLDALILNLAGLESGHVGPLEIFATLKVADALHSDFDDELDATTEDDLTAASPPVSTSFYAFSSPCPKLLSERVSLAASLVVRQLRC